MGIYERDYIRRDQRTGRAVSLHPRGFTVVTWLIIINVAVFVIDTGFQRAGISLPVLVGTQYVEGHSSSERAVMSKNGVYDPSAGRYVYELFAAPTPNQPPTQLIGYRFYRIMPPLEAIGHFSTVKAFTHIEVWRFITFQFLHANVTHILFNMIGLYFFGPLVERYLGGRLFLAFYLVCGIFGAFVYLILNLIGFLVNQPDTPLIGASAGVFGVLMASAFIARDAIMLLFFAIPMRVSTGAYLFVALAAFNLFIQGKNAGGDAAHLGGAAAGFFFIRKPHLLLDFFDDFLGSSDRSKARRVARGKKPRKTRQNKRLDEILDKVHKEGMHALSEDERKFLADASEERR